MTDEDDFDFSEVVAPSDAEFDAYRDLMQLTAQLPALMIDIRACKPLTGRQWRAIAARLQIALQKAALADDEGISEFTPSKMVITPHRSAHAPGEEYCVRCLLRVDDPVHDLENPQPSVLWGPP